MRIAILDDIHNAYEHTAAMRRLRQRGLDLTVFTEPWGTPEALRPFDMLVANRERTRFPRELLEQLPNLKVLVQTGTHAYHIDFDAARERGVQVLKAGGSSNGAAELTIGLMIALVRQILPSDAGVRRGEWPAPLGLVVEGKTLGIVGLGRLGQVVARVANVMGMHVVAWSPSLTLERAGEHGAERLDLDKLLTVSDVVSIHAPLNTSSRGMIDARRLALMKPSAYLINTSRGPIVDEAALVEALRERRIAGAALDVFDQEPLPPDHPLTSLPNVILTPHIGWPTDAAYERFAESAVSAIEAYLDGRQMPTFDHQ